MSCVAHSQPVQGLEGGEKSGEDSGGGREEVGESVPGGRWRMGDENLAGSYVPVSWMQPLAVPICLDCHFQRWLKFK